MPPGLAVGDTHFASSAPTHPELFTEAIVLHARQGDRGLSLADSGGLDIEGERGRCHIDAAATPRLSMRLARPRGQDLRR